MARDLSAVNIYRARMFETRVCRRDLPDKYAIGGRAHPIQAPGAVRSSIPTRHGRDFASAIR